ncbi:S53 family peptidase [Bradyrhizobium cytisi]|uniref:S8/S53 family peptidase n=1 Tax=Bradyrhizobium cytisi TaxID=515489 RepID=A0A5S4WJS0_9BRAD|nr:S53 family peptidase [Bradyrhizobium cytisi]TYL81672.1 S8/S53 family peptidase [Bradyrhizobium cytisi]
MASKAKARTGRRAATNRKAAKRDDKTGSAGAAKRPVVVSGSARPPTAGARRLRDENPRQHVEITLTLRGPKLPDADKLGGRAMSRARFRARYSASKSDADKVSQVLRKFGLKVVDVSLETRSMRVSGTVAQMEKAFQPRLGVYWSEDQGQFRDREDDYKIPASLKKIVTALIGFGQRRVMWRSRARIGAGLTPLSPSSLEALYHFPPGDGAGQKIAIAEFGGGYFAGDLALHCKTFGRKRPKVEIVSINWPVRNRRQIEQLPKDDRQDALDDTGEVMMDVEVAAGLAPGAKLSVYFATFDQKGWVDLLNRVIKDRPVALSVSWGSAEDSSDWSPAARTAINERLQAAAALGITICGASGDDGAGDEETDGAAHVDFPSCSPFVLAVGGTMIMRLGGEVTEQVWWETPGRRMKAGGGATGGGVSEVFRRPAWQRGIDIASLNGSGHWGRIVPDLAALAGPPGYAMIFRGKPDYGGGTSASAPLLAALIARVNALLPSEKRQRFLAPLLYRKSPLGRPIGDLVCYDITIGHNASKPKPGVGYEARRGFDAVSGWGAPIGTALLLALS